VPKYENLSMKEIFKFLDREENRRVFHYLPDNRKEILRLPKWYTCSIIYTVLGQPFKDWVN